MKRKTASNWLFASVCLLALTAWNCAGAMDVAELRTEAASLAAKEQKTRDEMVRLALLSKKLHDEASFQQWMIAAVAADPSKSFTSQRSPLIYVQAWTQHLKEAPQSLSVRKAGRFFYAAMTHDQSMFGIDRIDPLTQEFWPVQEHEEKAYFSYTMDADYDGNFDLACNGIIFRFAADGAYLGQVVGMDRTKLLSANTALCTLANGQFYMSDHWRHLSRIDSHADVLKRGSIATDASSALAAMDADKDENLYAALGGENKIVMFRPDLSERCRIGGPGTARGQFLSIVSIGAANLGFVTADPVLRRMQVFDRNGLCIAEIPGAPYSVAIDDAGTILALEGARIVCYVRLCKNEMPADPELLSYLEAVGLMEEGRLDEARKILLPLKDSNDSNLAQVAASLMENETWAYSRHYENSRPLTDGEAARLLGRKITGIFRDEREQCTWAALPDGFVRRIDEFERVKQFDVFPALHGLAGKLLVSDMHFDDTWCWAQTNRGLCRYSRSGGDWQFYRDAHDLGSVREDGK